MATEFVCFIFLKSSIFKDITGCSPLKVSRRFGIASPAWLVSKDQLRKMPELKQVASIILVPPKRRLALNKIRGVVSHRCDNFSSVLFSPHRIHLSPAVSSYDFASFVFIFLIQSSTLPLCSLPPTPFSSIASLSSVVYFSTF
jgi:hypothetical protein